MHPISIGRLVRFRLPDTPAGEERWRPAVVIGVVEEVLEMLPPQTRHRVVVDVLLDGHIDADMAARVDPRGVRTVRREDVIEGTGVGRWCWPPHN